MKRLIAKMLKLKEKKGFTLIELIATIAILGVLVLLAAPRFGGHVQTAEMTKGFADAKSIQKASELYFMDNEDWPRLTDDPYTSEEMKAYSEHIYDTKGEEVSLDPNGNYYNIDYNKLKEYIKVPSNKEDYILQNPVGKIFYMDGLTESGSNRVDYTSNKQANLRTPSKPVVAEKTENSYTVTGESGSEVKLNDGEWKISPHLFEDLNDDETYTAYSRFKETEKYSASKVSEGTEFEVEVALPEPVSFSYSGSSQKFLVPKTGTYRLEVWGAQGGKGNNSIGGRGGYSLGIITLNKDKFVEVYVGGSGETSNSRNVVNGGWNGGGGNYSSSGGSTGGGATDIRLNGTSLTNRVIVAGGGSGGAWAGINGAAGGGLIGERGRNWGDSAAGLGGTQSSGGSYSGTATGGGQKQSITMGSLGQGGRGSGSGDGGSGGGGGYYGGGGGLISPGGGGSSYIGGVQTGQTIAGNQSMPNPNGGTMIGNSGNGFARITRVD